MVGKSIQIEPLANDIWDGTVRYGSAESTPPQTGESSFAFDTGGGTQHITHSRSTVAIYAPSGVTATPTIRSDGHTSSRAV